MIKYQPEMLETAYPHDRSWFAARIRRHVGELVRLAVPIVINRAGIMGMGLVDTIMVGHYSSQELAYQSIGLSLVATVLSVSIGLMIGTLVMVSHAYGANDLEDCGLIWRRSLRYGLAIGVAGAGICAFGPYWLTLLGQNADLAQGGGKVLQIFGLSLPAFLIYLSCTYFLEGIGRPYAAMAAMFFANIVNALANWVLIFGHLGLPEMGAAGSAWATTTSRIFLAIFMFTYIWNMRDRDAFNIRSRMRGNWSAWRRQRYIGYAAAVSLGVEISSFSALNIFAGWIDALALGGFAITLSIFSTLFMMASGIGNATAVRVGIAYGRKDFADMTLAGWTGLTVTILLMAPFTLMLFFLPESLVGSYTNDPALIAATIPLVILSGLLLLFDCGQTVMGSALRGRGETWAPTILYGIAYYGVMIPLAWYLAFPLEHGAAGLFEAMIAASILSATLLATRFHILSLHDLRRAAAAIKKAI